MEELANQESWEDVQRILQVQIQDSSQSSQPPIIETPQQHEKTNKRNHFESSQIVSEVEEEKTSKTKYKIIVRRHESSTLECIRGINK